MSKKRGSGITGIVMIGLFLALYYGVDKVEWLQKYDRTQKGIVILVIAIVICCLVDFVSSMKQGGNLKMSIIKNAVLIVAACIFIGIYLLINKTGVSENYLLIPWIGIPVVLMILSSPQAKGFLGNLFNRKKDDEDEE